MSDRDDAPPAKRARVDGPAPSPAAAPAATPANPPAEAGHAALTAECSAFAESVGGHGAVTARLAAQAAATVQRLVRQRPQWAGATVAPFGSCVTTLATATSDVDLSVSRPPPPEPEVDDSDPQKLRKREQKQVKQLAALMRRDSSFVMTEAVPLARVPIVRCLLAVGGIQCDVSFGNDLAVENSRLLHAYMRADPRARPLALVLSAWGKARGVVGATEGGLTSYALLLMLLGFLQCHDPPVLPCLQPPPNPQPPDGAAAAAAAADAPAPLLRGCDCRFDPEPPQGWPSRCAGPEHTLGRLLHGFFAFYSRELGSPPGYANPEPDNPLPPPPVVCVRLGRPIALSEKPEWTEPRWLNVEDPLCDPLLSLGPRAAHASCARRSETRRNVANSLRARREQEVYGELVRGAECTAGAAPAPVLSRLHERK